MLNDKEIRKLHLPRFMVIRETEDFIELVSEHTGLCWNVFKTVVDCEKRITLYHKNKIQNPYYHKMCICESVEDAIKMIRSREDLVRKKRRYTSYDNRLILKEKGTENVTSDRKVYS